MSSMSEPNLLVRAPDRYGRIAGKFESQYVVNPIPPLVNPR